MTFSQFCHNFLVSAEMSNNNLVLCNTVDVITEGKFIGTRTKTFLST